MGKGQTIHIDKKDLTHENIPQFATFLHQSVPFAGRRHQSRTRGSNT